MLELTKYKFVDEKIENFKLLNSDHTIFEIAVRS